VVFILFLFLAFLLKTIRILLFKCYLIPIILNMGKTCFLIILHFKTENQFWKFRYSFAIVGINLTHLAYNLWKDGTAKTHIYNLCYQQLQLPGPTLLHFHRFYCYLFIEFDKLWMAERPPTIMEFGRIRSLFENNIRSLLSDPQCLLKLNIPVEHV
jgi:hypothetical protein